MPLILDIGLNQEDHYQDQISEFRGDRSSFNNHLENDGFSFISFTSDRPNEKIGSSSVYISSMIDF